MCSMAFLAFGILVTFFYNWLFSLPNAWQFTCENDRDRYALSIDRLTRLLDNEQILLESVQNYIEDVEKKLAIIKIGLKKTQNENRHARKSSFSYVANPLNRFKLIRRMHRDWQTQKTLIEEAAGGDAIKTIKMYEPYLPSSIDLLDAALDIYSLQITYKLRTADLALGQINGIKFNTKLTWLDCYKIGLGVLQRNRTHFATPWFRQALLMYEENKFYSKMGYNKSLILTAMARNYLYQKKLKKAAKAAKMALKEDPINQETQRLIDNIENERELNTSGGGAAAIL